MYEVKLLGPTYAMLRLRCVELLAVGMLRLSEVAYAVALLKFICTGLVMSLNRSYNSCFSLTLGPSVMYTHDNSVDITKLSSSGYSIIFVCLYSCLT
jgi:hypothetical protein